MSLELAARKLGLGFRPSKGTDVTSAAWIESQLTETFQDPGVARYGEAVGTWPDDLVYSLDERVTRFRDRRAAVKKLDKARVDNATRSRRMNDIWSEYTVFKQDLHHFAARGAYGDDQIRQRLMFFWANHFTVGRKGDENIEFLGHYLDVAIYGALDGSFADMLYGATTHPAMLSYLDNNVNVGERSKYAARCRRTGCQAGSNDNLARELMELHTVSPARGYTEDDIRGAADILTGWGYPYADGLPFEPKDFWTAFFSSRAEPGTKTVLGVEYPAGDKALRMLTDTLAADPFTPRFLSRKLAAHFIGDAATDDDIEAIHEAWVGSDGDLPTVHRVVLDRALAAPPGKFLWPMVWLFQALRVSGAHLFYGYEEIDALHETVQRHPDMIFEELGFDFWAERQPNGYSDRNEDWISTEHMDRRVRFAALIHRFCNPERSVDEIMDVLDFDAASRALVNRGANERERFVLCLCSRTFMEV